MKHGTLSRCSPLVALMVMAMAWGITAPSPTWATTPADAVFAAVVGVKSMVPGEARTAPSLGTRRSGSGVVIDEAGLVVTVGYLILEASSATVVTADGVEHPAQIVAYDHATGLGLLRALTPLDVTPLPLGQAEGLVAPSQVLVIASASGSGDAVRPARVVSRRAFAGYWEYLLEDAIFTAPPHPQFGGAALVDAQGRLLGIGSLVVGDALPGETPIPGNMFIPVDHLTATLERLIAGERSVPPRAWLGLYMRDVGGRLLVTRVAEDGPAAAAGIAPGELILGLEGREVTSLAAFYRQLWRQGAVGEEVELTVLRGLSTVEVQVEAADRYHWLRLNPSL
ncbi:MAG: S1C family serine protease [Candidatus Competibacterales bacterium]